MPTSLPSGKMLPGAGLYLRDSLYSSQPQTSERPAAEGLKRKYFERKGSEQTLQEKKSFDRNSMAPPKDSSEGVINIFSSLTTVFNFADFASSLGHVSSENEVFVNLIQRVRHDVAEASRLYTSHAVSDYLDAWPDKKTWIDAILLDVQRGLNDIGIFMETVRVSGDDGGTVGLRRKFEWVLTHHKKLISKQQYLTLCHQSLMAAVQVMQAVEMSGGPHDPIYEAPARPWIQDDREEIMRGPNQRHKWRMSQKNLSLPSISVSDTEVNKVKVNLVNSAPVELPGSTPDDLPDPSNWDLYASPPPSNPSLELFPPQLSLEKGNTQASTGHAELDALSPEVKSLPHLSEASAQVAAENLSLRRSFEQIRLRQSPVQERPRASLDQIRPRAYSDQVRPRASFDSKPRSSFDTVQPLPTVTEKPVGRNDSTASVTTAITMPILAKRYRPQAVQVRKPPMKHRSLPSELPQLPSQTSLIAELSRWVLPNAARESYQSTDTNSTFDASTPSTSVESSPIISQAPLSCPGSFVKIRTSTTSPAPDSPASAGAALPSISTTMEASSSTPVNLPSLVSTTSEIETKFGTIGLATPASTNSCRQESMSPTRTDLPKIRRRPLPNASRRKPSFSSIASSTISTDSPLSTTEPSREVEVESGMLHEANLSTEEVVPPHSDQPKVENEEPSHSIPGSTQSVQPQLESTFSVSTTPSSIQESEFEKKQVEQVPVSPAQTTASSSLPKAEPALAAQEKAVAEEQAPPLPQQPKQQITSPPSPPPPTPPVIPSIEQLKSLEPTTIVATQPAARPMTSQAKRRVAHARRMELAYGAG